MTEQTAQDTDRSDAFVIHVAATYDRFTEMCARIENARTAGREEDTDPTRDILVVDVEVPPDKDVIFHDSAHAYRAGQYMRQLDKPATVSYDFPVTFYPTPTLTGIRVLIHNLPVIIDRPIPGDGEEYPASTRELHEYARAIAARNTALGIAWPLDVIPDAPPLPAADTPDDFPIHTGQEVDALIMSMADAQVRHHWTYNDQTREARFHHPSGNHVIRLAERKELDPVDVLLNKQDANNGIALLCVLGAMAIEQDTPLPANAAHTAMIDLLAIAKKSGMISRDGKNEREKARARVWALLQYGARGEMSGTRTGKPYKDSSGKEVPTRLSGAVLWTLSTMHYPNERDTSEQLRMFPLEDVPLLVRVTLNKDWEPFLFGRYLPQYIKFGERIGAIPAGQPRGAWAQVMGMAYLRWARIFPHEAMSGNAPTRRELLTKYTPATGPIDNYARDPKRIVETYLLALEILEEKGIVKRYGDVLTTAEEQISAHGSRKGWLAQWLDAPARIKPGADLRAALNPIAEKLPPPAPPRRLNDPAEGRRRRRRTPRPS